jgi:hypothetical protein
VPSFLSLPRVAMGPVCARFHDIVRYPDPSVLAEPTTELPGCNSVLRQRAWQTRIVDLYI